MTSLLVSFHKQVFFRWLTELETLVKQTKKPALVFWISNVKVLYVVEKHWIPTAYVYQGSTEAERADLVLHLVLCRSAA